MSGLFDKRTDVANKRNVRNQKELDARKKTRIITVSVVSAVIVLFVCALIINSGFIRRALPAVTIGGREFTATEFDYFFNSAIFEYTELVHREMPEFASAMLPVSGRPLGSQIQNTETGATWADFFAERAKQSMTELVQLYNSAQASGFVIAEETRAEIEEQVNWLMMDAEMNARAHPQFYPTPMSYLQAVYGSSINESTLRDIIEFIFTASSYFDYVRESFEYSVPEMDAFHLEHRDDIDVFRYRVIWIQAEHQDPLDFETGAELEEAQEAAQVEAWQTAANIAATVITEDDFINAARELNPVMFGDERSTLIEHIGEVMEPDFMDWLLDDSRTFGDTEVIETHFGLYVLFFIERDSGDYFMTSMRQILIERDDVELVFAEDFVYGEDDPDYIAAREEYIAARAVADEVLRERADAALAVFEVSGATEQVLIDMMPDFSDSAIEGGLYENIARFSFPTEPVSVVRVAPELEQWLFDDARQIGDYELVYTVASGYHLVFFMGHGQRVRDLIASERMSMRDQSDWLENLPEVEITRHWAFVLTQA